MHFRKNYIFGVLKYNKISHSASIHLKKLLLILLLFNYLFCGSQTKINKPAAKSSPPISKGKKYSSATTNAVFDSLNHSTCLEKQFSIVFYVVLDSAVPSYTNYPGVGAATAPTLALLISEINKAFKPICVSFANCSTVYIPNFSYGKSWTKTPIESYVTAGYYTDKTINFYIVDTVYAGNGNTELEGYTYNPTPANLSTPKKDLLVLDKYKLLQGNFAIVKHLLGHFFGLPHTFDEINPSSPVTPPPPFPPVPGNTTASFEFADGSNCYTHGDGFCDTEADSGDNLLYLPGWHGTLLCFSY